MSANFDGDSEMLSSSESESPLGARTPTYTKHAELSPPGSQTSPSHQDRFGGHDGDGELSFEPSFSVSTADNFGKPSSERAGEEKLAIHAKESAPGASWNNQRAQEEHNRAMEHVVDRNFSLGEFGDPFDESDMLQGPSGILNSEIL